MTAPVPGTFQTTTPGSRVLVVDDCHLSRALMERALTRVGFQVYFAESGTVAVDAIVGGARHRRAASVELPRFDILLIDVNMPGLSGPDTIRQLRLRGSRVPIVACTGSDSDDDRDQCLRAGCDHYVRKPFRPEALVEACQAVLKKAA